MNLIMLGTAGSSPTRDRGLPSVAIIREGEVFLFDCGEGTQMQMLKYDVNPSKVEAIFLSHAHGDHVIGIAGLVRTMALNGRTRALKIFVPTGYEGVIKSLIVFDKAIIGYAIEIIGIGQGVVYKGKGFSIQAFDLNHTIKTLGYVIKEDDRLRFMKDKCKALGIKGLMFKELEEKGWVKVGKKRITLKSVTTLQHGKKIAYVTDTRPTNYTIKNALGADLLIHESSYAEAEGHLAKERKHTASHEAALIAKKAKVKLLMLTHISARYRDTKQLLSDAKKVFKNTIIAQDGQSISI